MHGNRLLHLALALGLLLLAPVIGVGAMRAARAEDARSGPARARVPILYEVDTKPKIYLFGTIHAGTPRLLEHPPVVRRALEESEALYTELAFEPEQLERQASSIFLPEGGSLKKILPADLYEQTRDLFAQRDIELKSLDTLKVWALWFQVGGLLAPRPSQRHVPMDVHLYRAAKKAGKVTGGLEEAAEQVEIFDGLTQAQQVRLLRESLSDVRTAWRNNEDRLGALIESYLRGDPRALLRELLSHVDLTDPFYREVFISRLLERRNVRIVRRLLAKAQAHPDKTTFVAVGTAHLAGRRGILALLTQTGFRVRKLETLTDMQRPWPRPRSTQVVRSRRPYQWRYRRIGPFCIPLRCIPAR